MIASFHCAARRVRFAGAARLAGAFFAGAFVADFFAVFVAAFFTVFLADFFAALAGPSSIHVGA